MQGNVTELLYADDMALYARTESEAQALLNLFNEVGSAYGQTISTDKTEVMLIDRALDKEKLPQPKIIINGVTLKNVPRFSYLGSVGNEKTSIEDEVGCRIGKMRASFAKMSIRVYKNRNLPLRVRVAVFQALVTPCGTYAAASWNVKRGDMERIESAYRRLLSQTITGPPKIKYSSNDPTIKSDYRLLLSYEQLIELAAHYHVAILPFECELRVCTLRYWGHVERYPNDRIVKQISHATSVILEEEKNSSTPLQSTSSIVTRSNTRQAASTTPVVLSSTVSTETQSSPEILSIDLRKHLISSVEKFGLDLNQWMQQCQNKEEWKIRIWNGT